MNEQIIIFIIAQTILLIGAVIQVLRRIDGNHAKSENNHIKAFNKIEILDNNVKSMNVFIQKQIQDLDESVKHISRILQDQQKRTHNIEIEIEKLKRYENTSNT